MKFLFSIFFGTFTIAAISQTPLSGNYIVGSGGPEENYPTLSAAIEDLQENGVGDGGVTLTAFAAEFYENLVIENIPGLSLENRLIIDGISSGSTTLYGSGTPDANEAVIRIASTSYVTIQNLSIRDNSEEGSAVEFGILMQGDANTGCQYNEIRNCRIFMGAMGEAPVTGTRGIRMASLADSPSATNSHNLIDSCLIDNTAWGIQISGRANFFSGAPIEPDSANSITSCVFGSIRRIGHPFSSGAIAINGAANKDLYIYNNVVDSVFNTESAPALPISSSAFSFDNCSGELSFNKVRFVRYEGTIGSAYGIRASIIAEDTMLISNNFISNISRSDFVGSTTDPSFSVSGIWLFAQAGGGGYARVLNNSIYMSGEELVSYKTSGFHLSGGSSGGFSAQVVGNIIVNNFNTSGSDYPAYAIADGNSATGFLIADFNNLIANGQNGFIGVQGQELGGINIQASTIDDWIETSTTGFNQISFPVIFENEDAGNLRLADDGETLTAILMDVLPEVPLDIDFNFRTVEGTHMGAHEGEMEPSNVFNNDRPAAIQVFPNPAVDEVRIELPAGILENMSVRIIDIQGRVIQEKNMVLSSGDQLLRFDVSPLPAGVYLIHLSSGKNEGYTGKFVKE